MKKYILSMASILALGSAVCSCEGYKDSDADDIVYYKYPAKEVQVELDESFALDQGDWANDNVNVITLDGTLAKATGMGTATLTNMATNPRELVFVTVPVREVYYLDDEWNLPAGEWENSNPISVSINTEDNKATAINYGTTILTNKTVKPTQVYYITVPYVWTFHINEVFDFNYGEWISNNEDVAKSLGENSFEIVGAGTAIVSDIEKLPYMQVYISVPYEKEVTEGEEFDLGEGKWESSDAEVVEINKYTGIAKAAGTCRLTNIGVRPNVYIDVTVNPAPAE